MLNDTFQKRFQELQGKSDSLPLQVVRSQRVGSYFPAGSWQGWATSCQNLLKAVYGENSPHYTNFTEILKRCRGSQGDVQALQGMFKSAKEDFEGGYVFNVDLKISGEVFGNFVVLAKQALAEGSSCLLRNEFHILAVNIFAFEEKWRFVFAKNSDLPPSRYTGYTEYQRRHLLATLVTVHWPPKPPFHEEPFTLMNQML